MKLLVHRGSHQIGGTCIELSAANARIILDAGLPLDSDGGPDLVTPRVSGLFGPDGDAVDAIFLTHAHADHSGLISNSRPEVPVWMTEGTSKMMLAGSLFARQPTVSRARCRMLRDGEPIDVGPFRITGWPVDHSVYGAAAFMAEAEGKRVLYTGDLRFHGRKPGMARQLVREAGRAPVDVLLIEGTRLGSRAAEANIGEKDLEEHLVGDFRRAPGVVLAMYSPLNVDRFVTLFRAARRARRTFVIDPYQAFVLHLIHRQTPVPLPCAGTDLRVVLPPRFASSSAGRRLLTKRWAATLPAAAITPDEILRQPDKFIVLFRPTMRAWFCRDELPMALTVVYSYWPGYLDRDPLLQNLVRDIANVGGTFLQRHASGHGHPDDLRRFVEEINPKRLIPVHTANPDGWAHLWLGTRKALDGEPLFL